MYVLMWSMFRAIYLPMFMTNQEKFNILKNPLHPALFHQSKKILLGSKYASVIINLILTLAIQLYSKITKINEIFVVTPHFYLKLVQKLRKKKPSSFGGPL